MSSETMRAITQDSFGGPEVLRLAEVPRPAAAHRGAGAGALRGCEPGGLEDP